MAGGKPKFRRGLFPAMFLYASLILVACLVALCGCGTRPLPEKVLAKALEASEFYKTPDAKITNLVVDRRQTDAKEKTDVAYCTVTAASEKVQYTTYYIVRCGYFDKGGWSMTGAEIDRLRDWSVKPVVGVTADEIGDDWCNEAYSGLLPILTPYDGVTVEKQQTDLAKGQDSVVVRVKRDVPLLKVEGSGTLKYVFKGHVNVSSADKFQSIVGEWVMQSWTANDDFKIGWNLVGLWQGTVTQKIHSEPSRGFNIDFKSVSDQGKVDAVVTYKTRTYSDWFGTYTDTEYSTECSGELKDGRLTLRIPGERATLTGRVSWGLEDGVASITGYLSYQDAYGKYVDAKYDDTFAVSRE